jgi:hypothetical protein
MEAAGLQLGISDDNAPWRLRKLDLTRGLVKWAVHLTSYEVIYLETPPTARKTVNHATVLVLSVTFIRTHINAVYCNASLAAWQPNAYVTCQHDRGCSVQPSTLNQTPQLTNFQLDGKSLNRVTSQSGACI